MTTEPARASLRRLLRLLRPQWPLLAAMLLLDLLLVPVALLLPLPLKIAIDCAIRGAALPGPLQAIAGWWPSAEPAALALGLATALVVVVAVARHLGELASAWLHAVAGERMVFALRQRLFDRSQRLSLAWHDAHGTADAVFRIHWDVPSVQHITVDGLLPLLLAACTVAGMIAVTAAIDWPLALIAMLVAPALIALVWVYRLPLRRHWRDARDHDASAQGIVQEVLAALRVVRAFGKEDDESARFVRTAGLGMRARLRLALVQGRFELLAGLCTALGTAAVLWFGVRHVQQGRLTLGDLLVVMAYLAMLYAPLRTISSKAADVQASLGGLDRALALLDAPPDIVERPAARPLPRARGAIAFDDVTFAYAPGRAALQGVSFAIAAGSCVGIEGPTGAGKSTLVSLLPRFDDPTSGRVLLDGHDLRDLRLRDLRAQFAFVLQEPILFSTTIAENIAYGRPHAGRDAIIAAARAAGAHDFVAALPDGYDTVVGERGAGMSGGERQRIALARAFLTDAPILILDEPTSAVDLATEAAIVAATQRLAQGRTTFVISHRPSTLAACDVRLRLEHGRLVECKTSAAAPGARAGGGGAA